MILIKLKYISFLLNIVLTLFLKFFGNVDHVRETCRYIEENLIKQEL